MLVWNVWTTFRCKGLFALYSRVLFVHTTHSLKTLLLQKFFPLCFLFFAFLFWVSERARRKLRQPRARRPIKSPALFFLVPWGGGCAFFGITPEILINFGIFFAEKQNLQKWIISCITFKKIIIIEYLEWLTSPRSQSNPNPLHLSAASFFPMATLIKASTGKPNFLICSNFLIDYSNVSLLCSWHTFYLQKMLLKYFISTGENGIKRHGKGKWVSSSVSCLLSLL